MLSGIVVLVAAFAAFILVRSHRRSSRYSIKHIRGPPRKSWLLGNYGDIGHQENVGDLDFAWVKEYGTAWRLPSPLGADMLAVADPKALQYIFHKSGYNFPKTAKAYVDVALVAGKSILAAQHGSDHSRHRKTMNPAFTAPQLRSFLPLFKYSVSKMSQLWKDELLNKSPEGVVIPINKWLARTTMDVIGAAAFNTHFGALDDAKTEVSAAYDNLFMDSVLHPANWNTLFRALWKFMPESVLNLVQYLPTREYKRFKQTLGIINRASEQLIAEKAAASLAGDKTRKDIMSILVRANASEDPKSRLDDEEMISQMAAFIVAGHETTASTTTWLFYELARHPEFQENMRSEIIAKRAVVSARGDSDFTMEDLESMTYLQAVLKETLRFHPIAYHLTREAGKDDVLPLSHPIETADGNIISEIPVAAGQEILISICAYNRLESVWGKDAHTWNPMRFIDNDVDKEVKLGMFGNLMSFSAGVRGCIGWRFSLIEMQAFVVDLLEGFRFSLPTDKPEIVRLPSGVMNPMIKGRMQEGAQMPLYVEPL